MSRTDEQSGVAESCEISEATHFVSSALLGLVNQGKNVASRSAYRQIEIEIRAE